MRVGSSASTPHTWAGLCGSATCGASVDASKWWRVPGAPASLCQGPVSTPGAPCRASQSRVVSSGATRPTCAPSSALMLHRVMRSGIDSARHRLAAELHRLVAAAVHAVAAEHGQHHVLGADAIGAARRPSA